MTSKRRLRIALTWFTQNIVLSHSSAPYLLYTRGFQELGHEVVTVLPSAAAEGYTMPIRIVPNEACLADPELWRDIGADIIIGLTWHQMGPALAAARRTGARVINISDSDGQISPRVHPMPAWRFAFHSQSTWRGKLGATRLWVKRFFHLYRNEHASAVEALRHSDTLVFCSHAAASEFGRILACEGVPDLAARSSVVPYPIAEAFCTRSVAGDRPVRVVSIARWNAGQKNAGLMEAALRRVVRVRKDVEVILVGRGGEQVFGPLCRECPRVRYAGVLPPEQVAEHLGTSRVLAISSRWESGPIVAFEAMALGTTVAAVPIHNIAEFVSDGSFGRVSPRHTPEALAESVLDELTAWDQGLRNPERIASYWRNRVSPISVCRQLLATIGYCSGAGMEPPGSPV